MSASCNRSYFAIQWIGDTTMKRQVLFIQGGGEGAHEEDARLAASLGRALGEDWDVRYPRMPNEEDPDETAWQAAIEQGVAALGEGAVLVAHSVGATILARMLAERQPGRTIAGIFLIAVPFVGRGGWEIEGFETPGDLGARLPRGVPVHLYHGGADEIVPPAHVDLYAKALPQAVVHRLAGRNHQLDDDLAVVAHDIMALGGKR